jgi:hypothetical protein
MRIVAYMRGIRVEMHSAWSERTPVLRLSGNSGARGA